jgi:transcriptional regulator with XRE-family HTH domain
MGKTRSIYHDRLAIALAKIREGEGIGQREMAGRLRRSQSYVAKVETGAIAATLPEIMEWCEAVGASPIELLSSVLA